MRHEFPAAIKRAALARSGGQCEAIGSRYGLPDGVRCDALLAETGIQYDHWPLGAHHPDSATLNNCSATCPHCNQYAANHTDKKVEAKLKRVQRKHGMIPDKRKWKPKKIPSRGFNRSIKRKMNGRVAMKNSTGSRR